VRALVAGSDEIERLHLPRNMTEAGFAGADMHSFLARTEAGLVAEALEIHQGKNKTQLADMLGYTDRFALSRRMRKILAEHPEVGKEYPKLEVLFR
ncbi:MAG: hypothetical protein WCS43_12165, partial [Verrucomicrobiota bacterium]